MRGWTVTGPQQNENDANQGNNPADGAPENGFATPLPDGEVPEMVIPPAEIPELIIPDPEIPAADLSVLAVPELADASTTDLDAAADAAVAAAEGSLPGDSQERLDSAESWQPNDTWQPKAWDPSADSVVGDRSVHNASPWETPAHETDRTADRGADGPAAWEPSEASVVGDRSVHNASPWETPAHETGRTAEDSASEAEDPAQQAAGATDAAAPQVPEAASVAPTGSAAEPGDKPSGEAGNEPSVEAAPEPSTWQERMAAAPPVAAPAVAEQPAAGSTPESAPAPEPTPEPESASDNASGAGTGDQADVDNTATDAATDDDADDTAITQRGALAGPGYDALANPWGTPPAAASAPPTAALPAVAEPYSAGYDLMPPMPNAGQEQDAQETTLPGLGQHSGQHAPLGAFDDEQSPTGALPTLPLAAGQQAPGKNEAPAGFGEAVAPDGSAFPGVANGSNAPGYPGAPMGPGSPNGPGYNGPGGPGGPSQGGPGGPSQGGSPNKRRFWTIIWASVVVVALVIALIVWAVNSGKSDQANPAPSSTGTSGTQATPSSSSGSESPTPTGVQEGSPAQAVEQFTKALAAGDATTALGLVSDAAQVPETSVDDALLSNASYAAAKNRPALKEIDPASLPAVGDDITKTKVTATLTQAGKDGRVTFQMLRTTTADPWRIDVQQLPTITVGGASGTKITVNGRSVSVPGTSGDYIDTQFRVLPGTYELAGNSTKFVDFGKGKTLTATATTLRSGATASENKVGSLNISGKYTDAFNEGAKKAVNAWLDKCEASTSTSPKGCPFYVDSKFEGSTITDVKWDITKRPTMSLPEYGFQSQRVTGIGGAAKLTGKAKVNGGEGRVQGTVSSFGYTGELSIKDNKVVFKRLG